MAIKPTIWPNGRFGVPQITPYTARDGHTLLELIKALRDHVVEQLHPNLQQAIDQLVVDVESEYDKAHDRYVDGVQEFQRIHDAFMSDVNSRLVALNDGAVTDLAADETSMLGTVLRQLFTTPEGLEEHKTIVDGKLAVMDTTITGVRDDLTTMGDHLTGQVDELSARLSDDRLDSRYDTRTRVNTKAVDGLQAALDTGEPVQLDEDHTYTGNLANLWSTNLYGTGTIITPTGVFTPDPVPLAGETITNHLYVNTTTGSPTHDGLTPDTAFDSLSTVYTTVLRRLTAQQASGAQWVVNMTGVFTEGVTMRELENFPRGLVFQGDASGATEIRRTSSTKSRIGIWIEPGVDTVTLRHLRFVDWDETGGYGALMKYGGRFIVEHCDFVNCYIGVAAIQNTTFRFSDNTLTGSTRGMIAQYNATGLFARNTVEHCKSVGVDVTRNSVVHVDYNHMEHNQVALIVDMASRANVLGNVFYSNTEAVNINGAAEWINNDNTWGVGVNQNGTHYRHSGAGRETRMHSQGVAHNTEFRVGSSTASSVYVNPQTFTDVSSTVNVYSGAVLGVIPRMWFADDGKRIRVTATGSVGQPTTYSSRVELMTLNRDGSGLSQIAYAVIPAGTNGGFSVEFVIDSHGSTRQRVTATTTGTNPYVLVTRPSGSLASERLFRLRYNPQSNTVGAITFHDMDVYFTG